MSAYGDARVEAERIPRRRVDAGGQHHRLRVARHDGVLAIGEQPVQGVPEAGLGHLEPLDRTLVDPAGVGDAVRPGREDDARRERRTLVERVPHELDPVDGEAAQRGPDGRDDRLDRAPPPLGGERDHSGRATTRSSTERSTSSDGASTPTAGASARSASRRRDATAAARPPGGGGSPGKTARTS